MSKGLLVQGGRIVGGPAGPHDVRITDGRIDRIGRQSGEVGEIEVIEAEGLWLCPGFVDLQVNGFKGVDFSSPALTVQDCTWACREVLGEGTAGYESNRRCKTVHKVFCESGGEASDFSFEFNLILLHEKATVCDDGFEYGSDAKILVDASRLHDGDEG